MRIWRYLLLAGAMWFPFAGYSQFSVVTVSGKVVEAGENIPLGYVNVILLSSRDSGFVSGTITNDLGEFSLKGIKPGTWLLQVSSVGYQQKLQQVYVGTKSDFLDIGAVELSPEEIIGPEVEITAKQDEVRSHMDKKVYRPEDNLTQGGGSVLQAMQNLPGVTVSDGKVELRGSDKIVVLVDGKQTALTGFGSQTSLDNIPASAIDRIEIINNPSAKYDANGNAGIINIVFRKENQEGWNGKVGFAGGLGALWIKQENLPTIRRQFQATPKVNPSLSLNFRKKRINFFLQGDGLYTHTLNKNEFVTRTYDTGDTIRQQTMRNRRTLITTGKTGFDWTINDHDQFSLSALASREKILDDGDEPFFNNALSERFRLWRFLEDEIKTTVTASADWLHKFSQPGHKLNLSFNYTFHRENEQYFFTNNYPSFTGYDSFKLLSDENVIDLNFDYTRPLKFGRLEAGTKFRSRFIPTNMDFFPGLNSPLDTNAGGWANYYENIPAVYGNYLFENTRFDIEAGLRVEYVNVSYKVDPGNVIFSTNGYSYFQPFPSLRFGYKMNERNRFSLFYNRRVDRPNEFDLRVFPKYDDAEIIKVGNPALRPQFTQTMELAFKHSGEKGYLYASLYHRITDGTITRIAHIVPGSTVIYNLMQNAGRSYNTGVEVALTKEVSKKFSFNVNLNGYHNLINSFSVVNVYPVTDTFTSAQQRIFSGNLKANGFIHLKNKLDFQVTATYLAPDIIPQGTIGQRFALDFGAKKGIQKGRGEIFLNSTDLLNTMEIKKQFTGDGFKYTSNDYYETQVIRAGYTYKF